MVEMVVGLAIYLWALGKRGRALQAKNTPLSRRQLYGYLSTGPLLLVGLLFLLYGGAWGGYSLFFVAFFVIGAALGYITLVYTPKWIIGAPKNVSPPEINTQHAPKWFVGGKGTSRQPGVEPKSEPK